MKENLGKMTTETRNPETMNLDQMSALEIVTAMNNEDRKIPEAIRPHLPEIAKIVDTAAECLAKGGRIIYTGAGTSGRLGILDASECPPTFGVSEDVVVGLIAGGTEAIFRAQEGAEDSRELGREDLQKIGLNANDIVIGIAASGRTPYVLGGLEYAHEVGAKTASVSCNKDSAIGKAAEIAVDVEVGPEVLTGSTRLKAGTCQKMILNMITTGTMTRSGKVYQNLMVDVQQTNEKLVARAERIVKEATGADIETIRTALKEANDSVKTAIVMILANINAEEAVSRLERVKGHVREAIK